jgi:hypothetical protein
MTRVLAVMALLAYAPLAVSSCAWFKKDAVPVLDCAGAAIASQVATIIAQLLAGNWGVLIGVGGDVLQCALATAQSLPVNIQSGAMGAPHGGMIDAPKRDAIVLAIKAEIAKRKGSR